VGALMKNIIKSIIFFFVFCFGLSNTNIYAKTTELRKFEAIFNAINNENLEHLIKEQVIYTSACYLLSIESLTFEQNQHSEQAQQKVAFIRAMILNLENTLQRVVLEYKEQKQDLDDESFFLEWLKLKIKLTNFSKRFVVIESSYDTPLQIATTLQTEA
jgi:hypothetical protein